MYLRMHVHEHAVIRYIKHLPLDGMYGLRATLYVGLKDNLVPACTSNMSTC